MTLMSAYETTQVLHIILYTKRHTYTILLYYLGDTQKPIT